MISLWARQTNNSIKNSILYFFTYSPYTPIFGSYYLLSSKLLNRTFPFQLVLNIFLKYQINEWTRTTDRPCFIRLKREIDVGYDKVHVGYCSVETNGTPSIITFTFIATDLNLFFVLLLTMHIIALLHFTDAIISKFRVFNTFEASSFSILEA